MADLEQRTVLKLPREEIAGLYWSVPHWAALAAPPANLGLVRHGGVPSAQDHVGAALKPVYGRHAQSYLDQIGDPDGQQPRALLAWGTRNTFQNLGLPGWHADRHPRLLCRPDELWASWTYSALCKFRDGRLSVEAIRFHSPSGEPGAAELALSDGPPERQAGVEWAITGQLLLWDGEIPPLPWQAACTYDLRHIWHLRWEAWQQSPQDHAIHAELMSVFMARLHDPAPERAAALAAIGARHGLSVADGYLHSSLGLTDEGDVVLLMQHGSLAELGKAHRALGSRRAILLDNGGSVGVAYWARRNWQRSGWASLEDRPTCFGNGSYFRPRGHAVLVAELREDIVERPFLPQLSSLAPWINNNGLRTVAAHQSALPAKPMQKPDKSR